MPRRWPIRRPVHLQLVRDQVLPGGHATHTVGCPVRLDGQPIPVDTAVPALGSGPRNGHPRNRRPCMTDRDTIAPLRQFVVAMTELVARTTDERTLLAEGRLDLAAPAGQRRLAARRPLPAARDRYAQYLLHADPLERFSVVSFVWGPGQRTPVHDHTVWGLVGVLRGAERCDEYRLDRPAGGHRPPPRDAARRHRSRVAHGG
jgi:hypothetical protein